jgi:hypothetical protein
MDRVLDSQWPPVSEQHNSAVQEFIGLSDITEFLRRYLPGRAIRLVGRHGRLCGRP